MFAKNLVSGDTKALDFVYGIGTVGTRILPQAGFAGRYETWRGSIMGHQLGFDVYVGREQGSNQHTEEEIRKIQTDTKSVDTAIENAMKQNPLGDVVQTGNADMDSRLNSRLRSLLERG